jgi:hypothetical protein
MMISSYSKLMYGYDVDNVSSKFINVQKIIYSGFYRSYILDNGYMYFNERLDTDNFVKINCTGGTDIKFIGISTSPTTHIFAVSADGKLYVVNDGVLEIVTNINYDHNMYIMNIFSSPNFLIIKTSNYEYYGLLHF